MNERSARHRRPGGAILAAADDLEEPAGSKRNLRERNGGPAGADRELQRPAVTSQRSERVDSSRENSRHNAEQHAAGGQVGSCCRSVSAQLVPLALSNTAVRR